MPIPQGALSYFSGRKIGHFTLMSSGGAPTRTESTIEGVKCVVLDYADGAAARKKSSIEEAIKLLKKKHYAIPNQLFFHLSSIGEGSFSKAPTEAICRNPFGGYEAHIYLGLNCIYSKAAMTNGLKEGIAHKVRNPATGANYTTAVIVHEIGHAMHDLESPDFFWGDADSPISKADHEFAHQWISPYAATNKKEVVAEVWTGHIMGYMFRKMGVYEIYQRFQGPQLHGKLYN